MSSPAILERGTVFGADHDDTFTFWKSSEPRWKRCLAFNVKPPTIADEVFYFIATSNVNVFRENPQLLSDVVIFAADSYPFFPKETAIDFRELCMVPLAKLQQKNLRPLGQMSTADIQSCEATARGARLLTNRDKRRLGLL